MLNIRFTQRPGDTPADDDDLGTEDVDQAAQANAKEMGRPLDFLEGEQVLGHDRFGQVAALQPPSFAGHLVGEHGR